MRFVRDNSLSIVLFLSFFALWVGQSIVGYFAHNDERADENLPAFTYVSYLASSHFLGSHDGKRRNRKILMAGTLWTKILPSIVTIRTLHGPCGVEAGCCGSINTR